jgi:acetolactate synthase I/II/III large subunit
MLPRDLDAPPLATEEAGPGTAEAVPPQAREVVADAAPSESVSEPVRQGAPEAAREPGGLEEGDEEHAPAADDGHEEPATHEDEAHDVESHEHDAHDHPHGAGREDQAPAAAPTSVAGLIAATLRAAGVRMAFTVPGESFLPVLDALHAAGIRVVATRHEGAAAMAAEAYGQLTGRPAVCLGTRAVGAANLAIGIHTATADSTPMFVLVGQVRSALRGREAFQEVDLVASIGRLARWAGEIDDPAAAATTLETATRHALGGRPGPVVLALPEDVLEASLPEGTVVPVVRPRPAAPEADDLRAALHFLAAAERPVILAGVGVLRARCSNDLVRLAELLRVPVIASWRRGDVISNDHPLYLGMTGFGSPATVRARLEAADAILVLGSRLGEITTYGYEVPRPGQRWMHVDVEPLASGNGSIEPPVRAIAADARAFVRGALARLRQAVLVAEPLVARDRHNAEDRAAFETASGVDGVAWGGPGVHPGRIIADLRRLLPDDAIVTTDAGSFAGWAARGFRFRRPGTFLGPTSGAMGYGLPAAIAAALVHRERRVVALLGDGGLGMTLAELETAVREQANLVAIVFDNERYGMIRAYQDRQGSPTSPGTDLGPVDFAAVARACGARGIRVETSAAFEPALRTALAASTPTVIHLVVDRRWSSVDVDSSADAAVAG